RTGRDGVEAVILPTYDSFSDGDLEVTTGLRAHIGDRDPGMQLDQRQAVIRLDLEDAQVGDDHVHDVLAGDGQRALLEDFRAAVFGGVIHRDDHPFDARHHIHGAAGAFDHLAGYRPVGQVAVVGTLQTAQDG